MPRLGGARTNTDGVAIPLRAPAFAEPTAWRFRCAESVVAHHDRQFEAGAFQDGARLGVGDCPFW